MDDSDAVNILLNLRNSDNELSIDNRKKEINKVIIGNNIISEITNNNSVYICKLLNIYKLSINIINFDTNSLLIMSCLKKNYDLFIYLIINNVDVNYQNAHGISALHIISIMGLTEYLFFLLTKKVNIDIQCIKYNTALHFACMNTNNNTQIIKYLLKIGINMYLKNEKGYNPIIYCIINNNLDGLKLFINNGFDINTSLNDQNYTLLHYLCSNPNDNIFEYILTLNNLNLNALDINNNTPIHIALYKNNLKYLKLLVLFGSNIRIVNNDGISIINVLNKNNEIYII
jgi:ankyrin repeat protein